MKGGWVGLYGRPRPVALAPILERHGRFRRRENHVILSAAKDLAMVEEHDRLPSHGRPYGSPALLPDFPT
ncbi:MAG TPA: hypothetical protein VF026_21010 [Ktedonobacteraceae bacterium]